MSLFEKSLDLQTRLFDKTISTLEAIGRSTGVTEQRLGDMLGMFQNPAFTKQIAGRAVEETATELQKKGKEGTIDTQTETQLAEKLTQNIVRELSDRFAGLEILPRGQQKRITQPPIESEEQKLDQLREEIAQAMKSEERKKAFQARLEHVKNAITAIPGAQLLPEPTEGYWDFMVSYKGKKIALDVRTHPAQLPFPRTYEDSIKALAKKVVDYLLFVLPSPIEQKFIEALEARNNVVNNKLKYIAVENDLISLKDRLLAAFESTVS
jgi:hypothetical protein